MAHLAFFARTGAAVVCLSNRQVAHRGFDLGCHCCGFSHIQQLNVQKGPYTKDLTRELTVPESTLAKIAIVN